LTRERACYDTLAWLISVSLDDRLSESNSDEKRGWHYTADRHNGREQQDAIDKRMRGGDQTATTKAAMAEAKVAN
jgi:hypothetical protein